MQFLNNNNNFYKEKHFVVVAGGKALFIGKDYKDVEKYFEYPNTCLIHQNDIVPNIHNKCWEPFSDIEYKHVKILSDQIKCFITLPAIFSILQFGHIWHQYYYRLFKMLFHVEDGELNNPMMFLFGADIPEKFTPQDPYYKGFTERLMSDFNIKDYTFNNEPTIYEVDNFWAHNGDFECDIERISKYFVDKSVTPWRKVYATKSIMHGKRETPLYLQESPNSIFDLWQIDKNFRYEDEGYSNVYEALVEQNIVRKKIYNEKELERFLESYGFECIEPGFKFHKQECITYIGSGIDAFAKLQCGGGCSIEENIRYFNEVKTLVSISASSLQNMIFMNPDKSNILELVTRFYHVNGIDEHHQFKVAYKSLYDAHGVVDQNEFSKLCNTILRNSGEMHTWHQELARQIKINYSILHNLDLNSRTLIEKMKQHPKILEILSL
jgi:hypothetical protein